MTLDFNGLLSEIFAKAPPIILAITLHEAAHAYAARCFGDLTAYRAGRLSLNPFRHIDLFGTLLLPGLLIFSGFPGFGWAKPVPVNLHDLKNPKDNMLWVAAAGPASNLLMAFLWMVCLKLVVLFPGGMGAFPLKTMCETGVVINLVMTTFNLLPIPPLDGGRILVSVLPMSLALRLMRIEPFGLLILLGLILFDVLSEFLFNLVFFQFAFLADLFNLKL